VDILFRHIAEHITLTEEERAYFATLLRPKKIRKKQFLTQEGEIQKATVFVTAGLLRSYSLDKNGFEHVIQFAPPGWWIADMYSVTRQQPGALFIDALEDSEIIGIGKADLDELYGKVPKFERFFRILAENSLITYQNRLISNLSLPAKERYANFCQLYPSLIGCLPQKQVASYIGVTPEFLSKMLNSPAGAK
jgi:CRP-like cAMP-binding protein